MRHNHQDQKPYQPAVRYRAPNMALIGREMYEELAGKYEYAAGMSRAAAESRALQDTHDYIAAYQRSH